MTGNGDGGSKYDRILLLRMLRVNQLFAFCLVLMIVIIGYTVFLSLLLLLLIVSAFFLYLPLGDNYTFLFTAKLPSPNFVFRRKRILTVFNDDFVEEFFLFSPLSVRFPSAGHLPIWSWGWCWRVWSRKMRGNGGWVWTMVSLTRVASREPLTWPSSCELLQVSRISSFSTIWRSFFFSVQ